MVKVAAKNPVLNNAKLVQDPRERRKRQNRGDPRRQDQAKDRPLAASRNRRRGDGNALPVAGNGINRDAQRTDWLMTGGSWRPALSVTAPRDILEKSARGAYAPQQF